MAVFQDIATPYLTVQETANDGSDATNAPTDFRRFLVGEDGKIRLKDAAGSLVVIAGDADAHIADASDAHDASAVSFDATGLAVIVGATDVQAAIEQLDAAVDAGGGGGGGGPAEDISNTISVIKNECYLLNPSGIQDTYEGGIQTSISGTAAYASQPQTGSGVVPKHPGVIEMSTGTSTTGRAGFTSPQSFVVGDSGLRFGIFLTLFNLSDGTNTYVVECGLSLSSSSVDGDQVIGFRYTHSAAAGNWQGRCRDFGVGETFLDTGVAASTTAFQLLEFELAEDGSSVEFFVNGVSVGTISTNIPTIAVDTMRFVPFHIHKSAGGSARKAWVDAYWYKLTWATARLTAF